MEQSQAIRFTDPAGGDRYGIAGGAYRILVDGEATGGAFAIIEMLVPPGGGPLPHRHPDFQETFVVVDGEVIMRSEAGSTTAPAGSTIHIPRNGPVHNFRNAGTRTAKLICTVVPAGLDAMFREAGIPLVGGEAPPAPGKPDPAQAGRMHALAMKYGQEIFPPDYFESLQDHGSA